ncbi:alpha/beta hydrolase family protein [Streptomyces sp. NRRL WC-3742]|uniref:alpha/beta hydrolase family protein n=1 Tax=Streptomyces sp. NRRL WC-3742 TaxID=1463934 RepID=UPI000A7BFB97|nr:acetylhydrolase [Streptomyces sp. NRRL WC-3742]
MTTAPITEPSADSRSLTRRRMLGAALAAGAVGAALPLGLAAPARASAPTPAPTKAPASGAAAGPVRLTLPAPTGHHEVGTVVLRLVDTTRPDPASGPDGHRSLMTSIWYPAHRTAGYPAAPWMSAGALSALLAGADIPAGAVLVPFTAGHDGAPAHPGRRRPVLLYSHGAHGYRADHTVIVQQLASHGFVVVTVDHTNDAITEFPDGRVLTPHLPMSPADCAYDLGFVLDRIEEIAAGRNPDADGKALPQGLGEILDLDRVGAFGWSKGGSATALITAQDRRIRAGLSIDAPMIFKTTFDIDRPFLMLTAENTPATAPEVAAFWPHLHGWRRDLHTTGAIHSSYSDLQSLYPQLAPILGWDETKLRGLIGTLDPARAVRIQQTYPLAFFDRHLRHRGGHLLDAPSRDFPEVTFEG